MFDKFAFFLIISRAFSPGDSCATIIMILPRTILEVISSFKFFSGHFVQLVRLLLQHPDIKVNMRGLDGYTALIRACGACQGTRSMM